MAIITRAQMSEALWPGIKTWFGVTYDKYNAEWKDLLDPVQSTRAYEKYVGFAGMGLAPLKPETESVKYDDFSQGYKTEIAPDIFAISPPYESLTNARHLVKLS